MKIDFKALDGIRGIAALYVVINHCRGNLLIGGSQHALNTPITDWSIWTKLYYSLLQLTSLGREFVVIFFVLSGFSIAHSLKLNKNFIIFYKKRLIRLYAPYIIALIYAHYIFTLNIDLLSKNDISVFDNFHSALSNLFYIPQGSLIPQFWSLTHEVIFYIIAPLILMKSKLVNQYYIFSILIYVISIFLSPNDITGDNILTKFIFDYNIYFAVGVFLYNNLTHFMKYQFLNKTKKVFFICIILFITMVILKFKLGEQNKVTLILSSFFSIFLILFFIKSKFKTKPLQFIGKISYTLYITHYASIYLFSYLLITYDIIESQQTYIPYIWILGVFFCVLMATPFYLIAEKPSKSYLNKLRNKTNKK